MSIIIVEPISSGAALVTAAHRLQKQVHVFTRDSTQLSSSCRALAASIVEVDTDDAVAMQAAARPLADRLTREGTRLQAIVPGFEYVVDKVAQVAERLDLPHLSVEAAALTRNKFLCREHLRRQGLRVPRYALIAGLASTEQAAREVGFPAVLKPVDGAGSLLVRKVESLEELRSVLAGPSVAPVVDMGVQVGVQFMLEEFLAGREFSIEGLVADGVPRVVAVTEKQLGAEPYFVEVGHVVPAAMDGHDRDSLVAYIERIVRAIGLNLGAFHAEARLTREGPMLIEIAARLGGDRIYRLVELVHGISLPELMLRSYCGEVGFYDAGPGNGHGGVAGIRFLSMPGAGVIGDSARGQESIRAMRGFEELDVYFEPGQSVPELTDFRGRLGHLMFRAEDRQALDSALEQAEASFALHGIETTGKLRCVVMNRWTDEFASYDRYIDHARHDVAYVVTHEAQARAEGCGAKFVATVPDFKNEANVSAAIEACRHVLGRIDRLICLSEYDLTLAARMRELYGIEGYKPDEVERFRDKTVMKSRVLAANLRAPRFVSLDGTPASRDELRSLRFPVILKPKAGAASVGVSKVASPAELDSQLGRIDVEAYQCEEFIDGPICHVDGLVSNGRMVFETASRYVGTCLAFAEGRPLGSIMLPSGARRNRLVDFAGQCLSALGLHDGAFHMEIIEGRDGPCFLEVGARVGGAEVPFTTKEVLGVDLIESWVRQQIDPDAPLATTVDSSHEELSGWLIFPEPVGTRLVDAKVTRPIASLYASVIPPAGHVFDGHGGYESVLGRFRYRAASEQQIENDIHATIEFFAVRLDRDAGVGKPHPSRPSES